jgi:hypothetical protein
MSGAAERHHDQLVAAKVRWLTANQELFRMVKEISDRMVPEPDSGIDELGSHIADLQLLEREFDRAKWQADAAFADYLEQVDVSLRRLRGSRVRLSG